MRPGLSIGEVEGTMATTLVGRSEDCQLEITHQIFYMSDDLLYSVNQSIRTRYIMKNFHS
jgi:hypothetical protein